MLVSRGSGVRFAILSAILAGLTLWLAVGAAAKFGVRLSVSPSQPRIGQPVSVLIRTGPIGTGACRMRLLAVAPGIDRYHALDALHHRRLQRQWPVRVDVPPSPGDAAPRLPRPHAEVERNELAGDAEVRPSRPLAPDSAELVRTGLRDPATR
jgi:hypothetical protein